MENTNFQSSEITFLKLIFYLWKRKIFIIAFTIIFGVIGLIISFKTTETYKADSTLIPAERYSTTMAGNQGVSTLGSIIGLTNVASEMDYVVLGIETLKSRIFIKKFLKTNNFEQYYSPIYTYDLASNKFEFDDDIYDVKNQDWTENAKQNKLVPSDSEIYDNFMRRTIFSRDLATNSLKLSTIHESPYLAKEVNYLLIRALNKSISDFDKEIATNSMSFIENMIAKTEGSELRQMLYSMYVKELEKEMFTEINKEYVFRTLDPPIIPLNKYRPSRLQYLIISLMLGFFLSSFVILHKSTNTSSLIKN